MGLSWDLEYDTVDLLILKPQYDPRQTFTVASSKVSSHLGYMKNRELSFMCVYKDFAAHNFGIYTSCESVAETVFDFLCVTVAKCQPVET